MASPPKKKNRSNILPDDTGENLPLAHFEHFNQRPVNYFSGVVREEDNDERKLSSEEANLEIAERLSAQRQEFAAERDAAYSHGFADGERKGRDEAAEQVRPAIELLQDWVRMLQSEKEELIRRYEKDVVELAFQISEKVLAREIQTEPEAILDSVRAALRKIVNAEEVTLRVNPEDIKILETVKDELSKELAKGGPLHLQSDESVGRGGCVLETENGILDGQVETQLNRLRSMLAEMPAEEDA